MRLRRVAVVVLAAGSSSRLGKPKQLLEFEGQTLIRRTVQTALTSSADKVVVTTADNGVDFEEQLQGLDWTRATVETPQLGQSQSIHAGVKAVEQGDDFEAILFTPCDLPLLSAAHLDALLTLYRNGDWNIVASNYDGVLGAPMIVDRTLWSELLELRGDVGGRKIIASHLQNTAFVQWNEGKFDLDTAEDMEVFLRHR